MADPWLSVGKLPFNVSFVTPIPINDCEFVTATNLNKYTVTEQCGIWVFHTFKREWTHRMKYDTTKFTNLPYHGMTYNEATQDLYLYGHEPPLIKINLASGKQTCLDNAFSARGIHPKLTSDMYNTLHFIGIAGEDRNRYRHLEWNSAKPSSNPFASINLKNFIVRVLLFI